MTKKMTTGGGGKPSKLPWIPPRFESALMSLTNAGHPYFDTDDESSPGWGRTLNKNANPHSTWDQTNPS